MNIGIQQNPTLMAQRENGAAEYINCFSADG